MREQRATQFLLQCLAVDVTRMASPFDSHVERAAVDPIRAGQDGSLKLGLQVLDLEGERAVNRDQPCQVAGKPRPLLFATA
ncbi:MAG TPA: hypothetical protein VLL94_07315 [Nitrospiraceae bacterium]|nr:hypothetical protein [Nitrospiraceae bacterium]